MAAKTFVSTAYGPPWNAMNGTGVTAGGTNLRPARKAFIIAVDPKVIPLGSSVYVWPNPFGHRGTFKADDTGGAIKGNRIDFYDWRGRGRQLAWGRRNVKVSTSPLAGTASVGTVDDSSGGNGLASINPVDLLGPTAELANDVIGALGGIPGSLDSSDLDTDVSTPDLLGPFKALAAIVSSFFSFITNSSNWLRLGKILLGFLMIVAAMIYLLRTLATSSVAKAVGKARP